MLRKLFSNWYVIGFTLFLFCLAVQLIWLSAFFPASMNGDSMNFWRMSALGYGYHNIQPILYTYLIFILRHIWNSPAIIVIFQTVISASLVSYFSVYLLKRGANTALVIAGYLAFVFSLPVGMTNIFIHKDALYAQLLLALSILLINLFFEQKKETKEIYFFAIGFVTALAASIRYDGAIFLLLVPLIIYFERLTNKKNLLIVSLSALSLYFFIQVPLPSLLRVKNDSYEQLYCLETQILGKVYMEHKDSFSASDEELMSKLAPLKNWDIDNPQGTQIFWNATFPRKNFADKDFVSDWNYLFWGKMKKYPLQYPKARMQMAIALLGDYRMFSPKVKYNDLGVERESLIGQNISDTISNIQKITYENPITHFFLWSPFFFLIHIGALLGGIIKKKKYLVVYSSLFLVSYIALLPMVTSSQYRYVYPLLYSSFFVPALYTLKVKMRDAE